MIRPSSRIGDPVGELLGLVEVLRGQQHRRAVQGELAHRLPHLEARLGVQARGRLVEERHRRGRRSGSSRCRAGGACPRSTLTPAGERLRRAGTGRAARPRCPLRPARCAAGPRAPGCSRPVGSSSTAADAPGEAVDSRTWSARAATSRPTTSALPASARSSVARIRTTVVLPSPVRAEQRDDAAPLHVEVDAAEDVQVLERLIPQTAHADAPVRSMGRLLPLCPSSHREGLTQRQGQARSRGRAERRPGAAGSPARS